MWHLKVCVVLLVAVASAESKHRSQSRRSSAAFDICDPQPTGPSSQIQCYCIRNTANENIKSAECFIISKPAEEISTQNWEQFKYLNNANTISFTNFREIPFRDIPTAALTYLDSLKRLDIKYANISEIQPYAFANLSRLEELSLSNNQIERLRTHAFIKHERLMIITLDKNNLEEINRNVFVELPSLEKLYLTSNKISTIHDKAFENLKQLKELEIDKNSLFALTNETFYGLTNLLRLELSHNALEVIGDNTFASLPQLQYLNLQGNRIQILDAKAFFGLQDLQYLSLSSNKLISLEHDDLFKGLDSLNSLHLSGNKLQELKPSIFKPILHNLYEIIGNFDIEDNNFPCNCSLEWLIQLQNKTKNKSLKNQLDNLKCQPDPGLAEAWKKLEDTEFLEDEANKGQGTEYEYYDASQLGGKLFYTDIRQMLNCSHDMKLSSKQKSRPKATTLISPYLPNSKDSSSTDPITPSVSVNPQPIARIDELFYPADPVSKNDYHKTPNSFNPGVLDLSIIDETTTNSKAATIQPQTKDTKNVVVNLEESGHSSFTTSRVASVSAKPKSNFNKYEELEMASDEAAASKSDRQKPITEEPILHAGLALQEKNTTSSANRRSLSLEVCILIAFIISITRC